MELKQYHLRTSLGAGSDGVSFHATDSESDRPVEVRILHSARTNPDRWARIKHRLALAQLLVHPAARQVLAVQLEHDPPFLVLEACPRETLFDYQRTQRLGMDDAFSLVVRLAGVLAEAHPLGLVHQGISPTNILREASGWTLDFTDLNCQEARDLAGEALDRGFRAKETLGGEVEEVPHPKENPKDDPKEDVFRLTMVLYWLLLDEPFSRECLPTDTSGWQTFLHRGASPQFGPICAPLARLFAACLASDPLQRLPASKVVEQLEAIRQALRGQPENTRTDSSLSQTRDFSGPLTESEPEADTLEAPPSRIGRFQLLEKLGEGGMGAVYRGRDVADNQQVALKIISPKVANDPVTFRRFTKEARLLAQVNSPYITRLLEFNDDHGLCYLALEFVDGMTVGQLLRQQGRLPEAVALQIAADVTRGLAEAHQRGIIHRDIKPSNILLTAKVEDEDLSCVHPFPRAKLSDFGLARSRIQSESLAITQAGTILGTPTYMSPEQCSGGTVDARSDIYSMGAMLFHLLVGQPPFHADSVPAIFSMHLNSPPPSLSRFLREVSEDVDRVVQQALAKNPDARYQSAEEFLDELLRLRRGEPSSIQIHPQLPETDQRYIREYEHCWDLQAPAAKLWQHVANTDRINQAMGLPPATFRTQIDPQLGVRRFGETHFGGIRIRWEEHPFEWVEGQRLAVLRQFDSGPFKWFASIVELDANPTGGTTLRHAIRLEPRGWLGSLLAKLEGQVKAGRTLSRIYHHIDDFVVGNMWTEPGADAFGKTAALGAPQRRRLHDRLEKLREQAIAPEVIEALGKYLEYGAEQEVIRLRPYALADRFQLDRREVLDACLYGVAEGLLVLLWNILCPKCQIPSDVKEALGALEDHGYCEACDHEFPLDFGQLVELSFRIHPEIRDAKVRTYCVGGPGFSPHVVAQVRAAAGECLQLELRLNEGTYRIRGPQLPYSLEFRVSPSSRQSRWELSLSQPSLEEPVTLDTGKQVLTLNNEASRELLVRIERRASRHDALTAAEASSVALFRELFPQEMLAPGRMVSVATVTVLMAAVEGAGQLYQQLGDGPAFEVVHESLRSMEAVIRSRGGAIVKTIGDGIQAVFDNPRSAVDAALQLQSELATGPKTAELKLRVAVHRGSAMVATIDNRLDYFGTSIRVAAQLLEKAQGRELLLTDSIASVIEVATLLRRRGLEPTVEESLPEHPQLIVQSVPLL